MFTNDRDKKLLAQRKKSAEPDSDVQSFEDYKRNQDENNFLGTGIPGKYLDKIGAGASKVGDVFKDLWYEITTSRPQKWEDAQKKKEQ